MLLNVCVDGSYLRDGVGPDPSSDVDMMAATDVVEHAFGVAGTFVVTLRMEDDDEGVASVSLIVDLGSRLRPS